MGKKKPGVMVATEDDISAIQVIKNSKKKGHTIKDDEYMIATELSDYIRFEGQGVDDKPIAGKKKKRKKDAAAAKPNDEDTNTKQESALVMKKSRPKKRVVEEECGSREELIWG